VNKASSETTLEHEPRVPGIGCLLRVIRQFICPDRNILDLKKNKSSSNAGQSLFLESVDKNLPETGFLAVAPRYGSVPKEQATKAAIAIKLIKINSIERYPA
jgi:hypothetical protein